MVDAGVLEMPSLFVVAGSGTGPFTTLHGPIEGQITLDLSIEGVYVGALISEGRVLFPRSGVEASGSMLFYIDESSLVTPNFERLLETHRTEPSAGTQDHGTDTLYDEQGFVRILEELNQAWEDEDTDSMEAAIRRLVSSSGAPGIIAFGVAADRGEVGSLVLVDALRLLARCTSKEFVKTSGWLMKSCLKHPLAAVRESALNGLLIIEDKSSVAALERAASTEAVSHLRGEMERGIDYLRSL